MNFCTCLRGGRFPLRGCGIRVRTRAYFKELELLFAALEIGFRFFDTAEHYGNGGAEEGGGESLPIAANVFGRRRTFGFIRGLSAAPCKNSVEKMRKRWIYFLNCGKYRGLKV